MADKENKRQAQVAAKKENERKYLNQMYENKIKLIKSKPEANTATVTTYKGYALKKIISLEKLVGKDIDTKDGVTEAYQLAKDGYYYVVEGFEFDFKPADLEPHERDEKFALRYCLVKSMNNYAINIATYALIGDVEKLTEIGNYLKNVENTQEIVDGDEQSKIKGLSNATASMSGLKNQCNGKAFIILGFYAALTRSIKERKSIKWFDCSPVVFT